MDSALFLDFDGVVRLTGETSDRNAFFCKERLDLLADILEPLGTRLVISSDWRSDGQEKCRDYIGHRLARILHPDWQIPVMGWR